MSLQYEIADLAPDEINLVLSSWSRSYRYATRETRRTQARVYYRAERDLIDEVLARYPLLLVARMGNVVLGWLCAEATDAGIVLHYVYVKPEYQAVKEVDPETGRATFQGPRIASALFAECLRRLDGVSGPGQFATHVPDKFRFLLERWDLEELSPERVARLVRTRRAG